MVSDSLSLVSSIVQKKQVSNVSTCMICDLPSMQRREIEEMMACGVSDNVISSSFKRMTGVDIDKRILSKHVEHLPAKYFTYREILQKKASEAGISLEDADNIKLTPEGYLNALLQDAMSSLVAHPNSTNQFVGMQVAKTLMQIEQEKAENQTVSEWMLNFKRLLDAIRSVCSEDQIAKILDIMHKKVENDARQ